MRGKHASTRSPQRNPILEMRVGESWAESRGSFYGKSRQLGKKNRMKTAIWGEERTNMEVLKIINREG